jgi:hypothetical protein
MLGPLLEPVKQLARKRALAGQDLPHLYRVTA